MNIRPLNDRVLIRRVPEKEMTAGGLHIPQTAKEKPQRGRVEAVGQGRFENGERQALDVKAGDEVLFGKFSGTEIELEGVEFVILKEEELLGVIEAGEAR
jgi:chaperonin GroES